MNNSRPRSFLSPLRYGIPVAILMLTLIGIAFLWLRPSAPLDSKAPNTFFLGLTAAALLGAWVVFLSGFRWYWRAAVIVLALALSGLVLQGYLVFDGDMVPHLRSPLERHSDLVEEHRREQRGGPLSQVDLAIHQYDWAEYRGPQRDGVVKGPALARDWSAKPPRLVWKQPCGEGYGSFAVVGTLLVTLEQRRDNEAVVSYDADSGRERWKHEYAARFWEPLGGLGPRATPTISAGEVFSLGAMGHLVCLDALTGVPRWSVNILEGGENLMWGMAGSPLVVDDKVIVNPGGQGGESAASRAVVAYDRSTGKRVWATPGKRAGYSSPVLATILGKRQIVLLDGDQVAGYSVDDGKELWSYTWDQTRDGINVAQPVVWDDGRVFISSGYSIGCAMIQVSRDGEQWTANELWRRPNKPLRCKMSSPVDYNGFVYGLDEGILACIDARDGALKWRDGRYGHGQMLRWEDRLIVLDEKGNLVMVEATPVEFRELGRVKAIRSDPRTWNVPALAGGRIYVRNDREMACFDLRD